MDISRLTAVTSQASRKATDDQGPRNGATESVGSPFSEAMKRADRTSRNTADEAPSTAEPAHAQREARAPASSPSRKDTVETSDSDASASATDDSNADADTVDIASDLVRQHESASDGLAAGKTARARLVKDADAESQDEGLASALSDSPLNNEALATLVASLSAQQQPAQQTPTRAQSTKSDASLLALSSAPANSGRVTEGGSEHLKTSTVPLSNALDGTGTPADDSGEDVAIQTSTTGKSTSQHSSSPTEAKPNPANAVFSALQKVSTAGTPNAPSQAGAPWQGRDDVSGDSASFPGASNTGPVNHVAPSTSPGMTAATATSTAPAGATLPVAVNSPQWPAALGQQVMQMHQRGDQRMELHLHPQELGPLSVSLSVQDQQAQLHILSAHAPVRAIVEAAIPQLREALAQSGIALGEAMVGDQGQFQQGQERSGNRSQRTGHGSDPIVTAVGVDATADPALRQILLGDNGNINLYA